MILRYHTMKDYIKNSLMRRKGWIRAAQMKKILISSIRFYKRFLSPLKRGMHCKYTPTCSQYAIEAIEKYGAAKGTWLAICRIVRCNPFSDGGYDPVP
jgi:putative membrane protein insertion efficiency factor